jgi:hypothetical protein
MRRHRPRALPEYDDAFLLAPSRRVVAAVSASARKSLGIDKMLASIRHIAPAPILLG